MQVVEVMSFFSARSDQPVDDGGGDDCGYDNRCHASLLCHNITRVGLSNRDCFQNLWHGFRQGFAWFPPLGRLGNGTPALVDLALVNRGGCVALITALGEKGDLPHPIALDYAATGT